jgi:hypothetical protein
VRLPSPKRTHEEAFAVDRQLYLQPTSPSHDHHPSIAATLPSPGSRPPDDGGSGASVGGLEEKKPQKMVRSSIACARCRRSKVKCKSTETEGVICKLILNRREHRSQFDM